MLRAAAAVPSAPLVVPGVSRTVPPEVADVRRAARAALQGIAGADVVVLVGPAEVDAPQVHDEACASLAGFGRPDLHAVLPVHRPAAAELCGRGALGPIRGGPLPASLAVLALLLAADVADPAGAGAPTVVPVAVPAWAAFETLVALGSAVARLGRALDASAALVVAGDLSAGLDERAPRHRIPGAADFDAGVVDVVASGRLDGLRRFGPDAARAVAALGWSSLCVLHGACAAAKVGVVLRRYAAPRGVGYLIARG